MRSSGRSKSKSETIIEARRSDSICDLAAGERPRGLRTARADGRGGHPIGRARSTQRGHSDSEPSLSVDVDTCSIGAHRSAGRRTAAAVIAISLRARMRVWTGSPYPLGATWDGVGVNFAIFSEHATAVELCLFDSPYAGRETARDSADGAHRPGVARLPARRPARAARTAIASTARTIRARGHRFNPAKLVFDPYAKAIGRTVRWHDAMFGFRFGDAGGDLVARRSRQRRRTRRWRRSIDPAFTWGDDAPPRTPWHDTIIYELHVRGFTKLHPDIPEELRGTYLGPGVRTGARASAIARRHGRRADADPPSRRRLAPRRSGS